MRIHATVYKPGCEDVDDEDEDDGDGEDDEEDLGGGVIGADGGGVVLGRHFGWWCGGVLGWDKFLKVGM